MVDKPSHILEGLGVTITTLIGVVLTVWPTTRWLGFVILTIVVAYGLILLGRWLEYWQLMRRPHLDFQIQEAFILPEENTAICFLHVSLHNDVGPKINNPPANAYSLQLTMKGKTYSKTSLVDPGKYELAVLKWEEAYNDEGYRYDKHALFSRDALNRVTKPTELVPGTRIYGWIGFAVHYLPAWETDAEHIGTHVEYAYDEDGVPIEESGRPVDDFHYIPHTRGVQMVELAVTDAYGQQWTATTSGPFESADKRIRRIKYLPEEKAIV